MANDANISYAQNREDLVLNAFFKPDENGFYVDVGANHPVHDSVTKLFYDKGWRGMNLEPTEWLFKLLCLERPRDITLQIGISDHAGSMPFREYPHGDGLSTFSTEMQASYEGSDADYVQEYKEYTVPVRTLAEIFTEQKVGPIAFMKVDIEGYEYEALAGNDWKKFRPEILCIESNHIIKDWHDLVKKNGYTLAFFDGLNEYFVSDEAAWRKAEFSYPDKILLGPHYISWQEHGVRQDLEREQARLRYELDKRDQLIAELRRVDTSPHPVQASGSLVRRGLGKVNRKVEHVLSSQRPASKLTDTATPTSAAEAVDALRQQLRQTRPKVSPVRKSTHKTYVKSKRAAKRLVKKGLRR